MAFRVQYMLLADSVQEIGSSKINILGTFDQIMPSSLPIRLEQFFMVALLVASSEDELGDHMISYQLVRPDGAPMGEGGHSVKLQAKAGSFGLASVRLIWRLANVPFKDQGRYHIRLLVDGREVASHPLNVRLPPATPAS
jgi:hypothetical protein